MNVLRTRRFANPRSQAGMTLLEVMMVVTLIVVVAAVVGNQVFKNKANAEWKLATAQIQKTGANIETYNSDVGEYPKALDDLVNDPGLSGWLGPYGKEVDLKDPWNKRLHYQVPGEAGAFDLISYGKDGQPGGKSVDADIRYEP